MKIVLVGGGVFSWSLLWWLSQKNYFLPKEIILVDGSEIFPACSLRSMAVVAKRQSQMGHTELAQLIQKSWYYWKDFVLKASITSEQGVTACPLYYHSSVKNTKHKLYTDFPKRTFTLLPSVQEVAVEQAFLIDTHDWQKFLMLNTQKKFAQWGVTFKHYKQTVKSVDTKSMQVFFDNGEKLVADRLVLQPGAYVKKWSHGSSELQQGKIVAGAFLELIVQKNWAPYSFSFAHEHFNLNYHYSKNLVQLGVTSAETQSMNLEVESDEWQRQLQIKWQQAIDVGWDLPAFSSGKSYLGYRHKLPGRLPRFWQQQDCFYHLGGYKIGYLVSLFQTKLLAHQLQFSCQEQAV